MKQNSDIEKLSHRTPFSVPKNYFSQLKSDIQSRCKQDEEKVFVFSELLKLNTFVPIILTLSIFITLFWNNSPLEKTNNYVLNHNELYTLVEEFVLEDMNEEYLYDMIDEQENSYDEEINYLIDINTEYDLIMNEL